VYYPQIQDMDVSRTSSLGALKDRDRMSGERGPTPRQLFSPMLGPGHLTRPDSPKPQGEP